eukprot:3759610-Rhodomonas_salina.1
MAWELVKYLEFSHCNFASSYSAPTATRNHLDITKKQQSSAPTKPICCQAKAGGVKLMYSGTPTIFFSFKFVLGMKLVPEISGNSDAV